MTNRILRAQHDASICKRLSFVICHLSFVILLAGCTTDVSAPQNQLLFSPSKGVPDATNSLDPVFPNPFNRATGDTALTIRFTLRDSGAVVVLVQNAIGDAIAQYSDSSLTQGIYAATWRPLAADGTRLNAGLYFVTLHTQNYVNSRLVYIEENE